MSAECTAGPGREANRKTAASFGRSDLRLRGTRGRRAGEEVAEAGPLARPAVHGDGPAVRLRDVLDQREAHPAPAPPLRLTPSDAIELLEDSLALGDRDADPIVRGTG